jgi:serine protease Do
MSTMRLGWAGLAVLFGVSSLGCKRPFSSSSEGEPADEPQPPVVASSAPALPGPPPSGRVPQTLSTAGAAPLLPMESSAPISFAPIAKHADPSVVTVVTHGEKLEPTVFGRVRRETKGLGSGFIVDRDGVILTNNHVIEGADTINVKLSDDTIYPANVVGRDPQTDVAVVKIDEHNLVPLVLGDSDRMEVGDWVVAIGNPFELSHTVSAGIISAKGRTVADVPLGDETGYYDFLQTDASINPGNSGGPLLNLRGEAVGINTAIRGGGAQGIGFAIPINMVKQLLPMLLRDGHVTRSALGVGLYENAKLTPDDKAALKLTTGHEAIVAWVSPGGPADKAHISPGDVILSFDGTPIEKSSQLRWVASIAGVGKTITLRVSRDGKPFETKVTLGQLNESRHLERPGR